MKKEDFFYTPGPWMADLWDDEGNAEWRITALSVTELAGDMVKSEGGSFDFVTERQDIEICSRLVDEPIDELVADLELISFAPEMFELCIEALNELKKTSANTKLIKRIERIIESAGTKKE